MYAAQLLSLRAVVRVQRGEAEAALAELRALADGLRAKQEGCAPTLLLAMVLQASLKHVVYACGFFLALPELTPAARREVWRELIAQEQAWNPLPDAKRQEHQFGLAALDRIGGAKEVSDQRDPVPRSRWSGRPSRPLGTSVGSPGSARP